MLNIRTARPNEVECIVDFQVRLAFETEALHLDPEIVYKGVTAVFEDPSKGEYWLAEYEGQVIGGLLTVPEWSDWRNGTVLWIHSVYVIESMRRKGVFRALYSHLKQRVEASDALRGLRLYVEKNNTRAQSTYNALGMTDEHYSLYEWLQS